MWTYYGAACAERTLGAKTFERCRFTRCDFKEARFEDCRFYDCRFERCDMSMLKPLNSSFREVVLEGCKVMGVDWQQASRLLFDVSFFECELSYCTFAGHLMKGAKIHESRAREADFSRCDLRGASFTRTDLAGARFSRTRLQKADFSDALNVFFEPRDNQLGETSISMDTGLALLESMGLSL